MSRLVLFVLVVALLGGEYVSAKKFSKSNAGAVAMLAEAHVAQHGVRLPTPQFTAALRKSAIDISHASCRKSLVMIAMANEDALQHTVPVFLQSLSRVKISEGRDAGQPLDGRLVLVAWSEAALGSCVALQANYSHQCVRDEEHRGGTGSFGFHSKGFNALGFAKIKYILNGLSAGYDVVFLDADILMLRDPLPYFLSGGGDMYGMLEKCLIVNETLSFHSPGFQNITRNIPSINIGVLYFKATAAVTRCVYNWIWDMHAQVAFRPAIWDQDIYFMIMKKCARDFNVRWQVLDPRLFQSACYPWCGCVYTDKDISPSRYGTAGRGAEPIGDRLCAPKVWSKWLLRHFPCSGPTSVKASYMRQMMDGVLLDEPAKITYRWT